MEEKQTKRAEFESDSERREVSWPHCVGVSDGPKIQNQLTFCDEMMI